MPVARALGLAYVYQDSTEVSSLLGQQGAASRFDSAIVTVLAAAFSPQSLPAGLGADIEDQTDVSELLDDLLELRSARYRRVPQYAARFRRKKCSSTSPSALGAPAKEDVGLQPDFVGDTQDESDPRLGDAKLVKGDLGVGLDPHAFRRKGCHPTPLDGRVTSRSSAYRRS